MLDDYVLNFYALILGEFAADHSYKSSKGFF